MECAGKGSRTPCRGPPTRRCHRCRAVAYCSFAHEVSHRSEHKRECERLERQMKRADILNEFPFTFTQEATQIQETRCSFLTRRGIHRMGMWTGECSCGASAISYDNSRLIDSWNLPSELCPCKGPSSPISRRLTTWKDYYEWRCIPLYSPAALLLHWPLTVYWAVQLAILESLLPEISNKLQIHYLGPEKELLQLGVFGELQALFPGVQLHIDLVGPSIPSHRDGEQIDLCTYPTCNQIDCQCKYSIENDRERMTSDSRAITLQLHAGYYHDCYRELVKVVPSLDSLPWIHKNYPFLAVIYIFCGDMQDWFPDIIIAPNAGIAAYTSWLPTLELIKAIKVPAVFSDYCEEALHMAARCTSSVTGTAPKIPIQINPFRQPLQLEETALYIPCHSNCFLFGF